jgi:gamma-glutamyltranspeptidase/glutathione hydrolase
MDDNGVKLVVGSPGGSTIITSVLQVILNAIVYDYDMQTAVDLPRFHHQWLPDLLFYENGLFDYVDSVSISDQNLKFRSPIGRVDAIKINENNLLECGADPRGDDFAAGY